MCYEKPITNKYPCHQQSTNINFVTISRQKPQLMPNIRKLRNLLTIVKGRLRHIDRPPITWIPHRSWLSMAREMIETISSFSKACYTSPLNIIFVRSGIGLAITHQGDTLRDHQLRLLGNYVSRCQSHLLPTPLHHHSSPMHQAWGRFKCKLYVRTYLFSEGTI